MDTLSVVQLGPLATVPELLATFGLIFGGCCSNALTLEIITSQYAPAGSLITFAQFLFVALAGLRNQLVVLPKRIPRKEAIQHVAEMSFTAKARTIYVTGTEEHAVSAFACELASALDGTISDSTNEGEGTKDPFCVINGPSNITCTSPHEKERFSCFRVFLQAESVSLRLADTVIDISIPDHPAILHPRTVELTLNPLRYRLKRRNIPLYRYAVQVSLFLLVSLLNNAAFSYRVPMAVHIIFRSGGLVVNMLLGWAVEKRRYSAVQVGSIVLVTLGIILSTLSARLSKSRTTSSAVAGQLFDTAGSNPGSYSEYAFGITMLSIALILSGVLGITQDRTFERYGRGNWEEAMFYLHALALPLFGFTWPELMAQVRAINSGPHVSLFKPLDESEAPLPLPYLPIRPPTLQVPAFYIPLTLNVLTQILCAAGVNRLTSRVNSLTVSLVLVVRKAVSLAISVLLLGGSRGNAYLWSGAVAVLIGTIGYTLSSRPARKKKE